MAVCQGTRRDGDALHDPGEARRAMVLPSRPGVGEEPQDLGRTRAVHHVHHRYTTEGETDRNIGQYGEEK
jgi:hypothetical protein